MELSDVKNDTPTPSAQIRSTFLLADSQLLFWDEWPSVFGRQFEPDLNPSKLSAAYVGAATGDHVAYYSIFEAAMDALGIRQRRMIFAEYSTQDRAFLETADVILIGGGNALTGATLMAASGMDDSIREHYARGAVLIGVSAGAMLLGQSVWHDDPTTEADASAGLRILPWNIDAHAEASEWANLKRAVMVPSSSARGLGLPSGTGAICHPDLVVEPLRRPIVEVVRAGDEIADNLLWPASAERTEAGVERPLG